MVFTNDKKRKTMTKRYKVGNHYFSIDAPDGIIRDDYSIFSTMETTGEDVFSLKVDYEPVGMEAYVEEVMQEEEGQVIRSGHKGGRGVFWFGFDGVYTGTLDCSNDYREAHLGLVAEDFHTYTVDNSIMVLYALATAHKSTLLMHASTVVNNGKAYLFLAPSGTGKSTHSQLWIRNIVGTKLLNDDNPVLVVEGENVIVYGSPWSGKLPCYKNESYPVGALVNIKRAKYNRATRLSGIEAYGALLTSASGKRWERSLADALHGTMNQIVRDVPVYRMECLPDDEAAKVCFGEVSR